MTWDNHTCDDCGGQTSGGPCIHNELWATIVRPRAVPIPSDPKEPFLFPLFRYVDLFLCFGCIERRLGRRLTQEDLNTTAPWNAGWVDHVDDGCENDSAAFKEMMERWKARQARGRRLLPHRNAA
jgi:hypothetical protein